MHHTSTPPSQSRCSPHNQGVHMIGIFTPTSVPVDPPPSYQFSTVQYICPSRQWTVPLLCEGPHHCAIRVLSEHSYSSDRTSCTAVVCGSASLCYPRPFSTHVHTYSCERSSNTFCVKWLHIVPQARTVSTCSSSQPMTAPAALNIPALPLAWMRCNGHSQALSLLSLKSS